MTLRATHLSGPRPFFRRRSTLLLLAVAAAAAATGTAVAVHYHRAGLTLSHYDARGHLVVARRVIDSLTPGWQQIGAVWLPLPHLLNLIPVQIDAMYRSGASAVVISVASYAAAAAAVAWIVLLLTGCAPAAVVAAAVLAWNPNLLYLQSTPMTEPLLLALVVSSTALLVEWLWSVLRLEPQGLLAAAQPERIARAAGVAFALACLTRYEAWPVTAAALLLALWVLRRSGTPWASAFVRIARIAGYPAAAVAAFLVHSRVVGGEWLTTSGFFVPENKALHRPMLALAEVLWGTQALSGTVVIVLAMAGLAAVVAGGVRRSRWVAIVPAALAAAAALPWAAFVKGHPFRIRYMVPLIAAEAVGTGVAIGSLRRMAPMAAAAAGLALALTIRPFDPTAPMVLEAQWDRPNVSARREVTRCLSARYDGEAIMASMASLGHYMQEMSHDGFRIRQFLHEGNGDLWLAALADPRPYAGWMLIDEKAEGGDMLAQIARRRPAFLAGFARLCEGAGVVLYRRTASNGGP